jgi:TolB-like protein
MITLAVLYFENTGDARLDPLRVGLCQVMVSDLDDIDGVKVVERQRLQAILDELKLGHQGDIDAATAARVGKLLGADTLLLGTYFERMGTLRIDARLVKVETEEVILAHGASDRAENFLLVERSIADHFRGVLEDRASPPPGVPAAAKSPTSVPPVPAPSARQSPAPGLQPPPPAPDWQPPTVIKPDAEALEAALAYSQGLIALDKGDPARRAGQAQAVIVALPWAALGSAAPRAQGIQDGTLAFDRADYTTALLRWGQALEAARAAGDRATEADLLARLGALSLAAARRRSFGLRFGGWRGCRWRTRRGWFVARWYLQAGCSRPAIIPARISLARWRRATCSSC